jgi:hypothetical protein
MIQHVSGCIRLYQDVLVKLLFLYRLDSGCIRLYQHDSALFQVVSGCIRLYHELSGITRKSEFCDNLLQSYGGVPFLGTTHIQAIITAIRWCIAEQIPSPAPLLPST